MKLSCLLLYTLQVQYCTLLSRAGEVAERIASQVAERQIGRLARTGRTSRRLEGKGQEEDV